MGARIGAGAFIAVALAVAAAGCGSSSQAARQDGRALFTQACGACHTLSGSDEPSHQGGDLLEVRLARPVLLQFAREMPLRHKLNEAQFQAVTEYVLAVQRRGR
jgi:mono/diheme cytochrome c family protein